jgi:hypothetical protein
MFLRHRRLFDIIILLHLEWRSSGPFIFVRLARVWQWRGYYLRVRVRYRILIHGGILDIIFLNIHTRGSVPLSSFVRLARDWKWRGSRLWLGTRS